MKQMFYCLLVGVLAAVVTVLMIRDQGWIDLRPSGLSSKASISSSSVLLKVEAPMAPRPEDGASSAAAWEREIRTQAVMLADEAMFHGLLQRPEFHNSAFYAKAPSPAAALDSLKHALRVRSIEGTSLIEVSVDRKAAGDEAADFANAIVHEYIRGMAATRAAKIDVRMGTLARLKREQSADLRTLTEQIQQMTIEIAANDTEEIGKNPRAVGELQNQKRNCDLLVERANKTRERMEAADQELEQINQMRMQNDVDPGVSIVRDAKK